MNDPNNLNGKPFLPPPLPSNRGPLIPVSVTATIIGLGILIYMFFGRFFPSSRRTIANPFSRPTGIAAVGRGPNEYNPINSRGQLQSVRVAHENSETIGFQQLELPDLQVTQRVTENPRNPQTSCSIPVSGNSQDSQLVPAGNLNPQAGTVNISNLSNSSSMSGSRNELPRIKFRDFVEIYIKNKNPVNIRQFRSFEEKINSNEFTAADYDLAERVYYWSQKPKIPFFEDLIEKGLRTLKKESLISSSLPPEYRLEEGNELLHEHHDYIRKRYREYKADPSAPKLDLVTYLLAHYSEASPIVQAQEAAGFKIEQHHGIPAGQFSRIVYPCDFRLHALFHLANTWETPYAVSQNMEQDWNISKGKFSLHLSKRNIRPTRSAINEKKITISRAALLENVTYSHESGFNIEIKAKECIRLTQVRGHINRHLQSLKPKLTGEEIKPRQFKLTAEEIKSLLFDENCKIKGWTAKVHWRQ